MTFLDKYRQAATWHDRALVMEIYHLAMTQREKKWSVTKTAQYFQVSIGLASENLRLAHAIHDNHDIVQIKHRQDALKRLPSAERTGT